MNLIFNKYSLIKICFWLGFLQSFSLIAQTSIDINKITVDSLGALNFWIKSTENGELKDGITKNLITITEYADGTPNPIIPDAIQPNIVYDENEAETDSTSILFLVDLSRDMDRAALAKAKTIIKKVVEKRVTFSASKFYLTTFDEQAILKRSIITIDDVDLIVDRLRPSENSPDFYRVLMEEIKFLKGLKNEGPKALIILGSGENVNNEALYPHQLPYVGDDLSKMVKSLPFNFRIFFTEFSENQSTNNFNPLVQGQTTHPYRNDIKPDYSSIIGNTKKVLSNYIIKAPPRNPEFKGEKRMYTVEIDNSKNSKDFRLGSVNFPINLQINPSWASWILWLVIGIIAILIILGVGSVIIPYIRESEFVKKYVGPYIADSERVRYDIYYNEPIQNGELVVSKCRQITPFSSWKENGWQCPNYPVCLNQNCNGAGAPELNDFFSMEGIYLKINWIWFGAMGGLLAWIIISLFQVSNFQLLHKAIGNLIGNDFLNSISQDNPDLVIQTIGNNLLVGIAFGAGLVLMLSWMEERRASRGFSITNSIFRISIRTIIAVLFSMLIFYLGFYLQYAVGVNSYLSGLVSWLIFGLGIGVIMSFFSSISVQNGTIGGIIAAVAAFHVYWVLSEFLNIGFLQANLFSLIIMGGVIGSILVSVVTTLEDYELEVVGPPGYQRTIPISKWLKSSIGVMIGKSPGCYIYVKWEDDDVKAEHAELFTEDGAVFIRPVEETLINQKLISKPMPLKHGDIIQLGRSSVSQFRFVEK